MHILISVDGVEDERTTWPDFTVAHAESFTPDELDAIAARLARGETVPVAGGAAPLVELSRAVARPFPLPSIL